MVNFLRQVIDDVIAKHPQLNNLVFILPTRRSIVYLKRHLSQAISQPVISPQMYSIEQFVEHVCGLKSVDTTRLVFELYSVYKNSTPLKEQESFEQFLSWAPAVLQDFNELDRYLINSGSVFNYLKAIKDLDHWSLSEAPTAMIQSYLNFWNRLPEYYDQLLQGLESEGLCYQGMAYRKAVDNLEPYISSVSSKRHIFVGFNALNSAESMILQELLENDMADIYWDSDSVFQNNTQHAAGHYMRIFNKSWNYYHNHSFNWIESTYQNPKSINVAGLPKQVGQAKYVGQLLKDLADTEHDMSKVAVVLGDENLLLPILNSIPSEIEHVNITMGLPLKQVPLASFFEFLFKLHKRYRKGFYYNDLLKVLRHSTLGAILDTTTLLKSIYDQNKVYISLNWLIRQSPEQEALLQLLFGSWNTDTFNAITCCQQLIMALKSAYDDDPTKHKFNLEYLFKFHTLFNSLSELNNKFSHITSIDALHKIYQELLHTETLDFIGEPLKGLQIMGMLESRALDFETVIITSVNEGILPGGKTQNSVIPFDVKVEYGLPTYKEKDAVYTYHFYRLLKRAKIVHLTFNTEIDSLKGGEKSRFIAQLEVEGIHHIEHKIISPEMVFEESSPQEIPKDVSVRHQVERIGQSGFSPSALTKYIRNPIDYYYQYILGIRETKSVEEHIAANTLGTILHEGLEELYTPFVGNLLNLKDLHAMCNTIPKVVEKGFVKHYGDGNFSSGKNLITFEVAKRYLRNVLDLDKAQLASGHSIKILALEHKASVPFPIRGLSEIMRLKGTVDRIDEFDGQLRIIDYKSGKVTSSELAIFDWDELITDYKRSKAFQLLCYAYIYCKSERVALPIQAGIISFKNLKPGVLRLGERQTIRGKIDPLITKEMLTKFEALAAELIQKILDVDTAFIEKEMP